MPRLVLELCLDQYFVEIYSQRFPQADYSYNHTVRLRLWVVSILCIYVNTLSQSQS